VLRRLARTRSYMLRRRFRRGRMHAAEEHIVFVEQSLIE